MIRGTTPYYRFKLPIPPESIKELYITFSQDDKVVFEKEKDDCEFIPPSGNIFYYRAQIHLSQYETLMCDSDRYKVEVQMTILTNSVPEERLSSRIRAVSAGRVLKEGVI